MCRRTIAPCCQDCGRPFNDLDDAGLCRHCAAITEEAIEATIRQQLIDPPPWFWRDVIAFNQVYDVPEPYATRYARLADRVARESRDIERFFIANAPKEICEQCRGSYPALKSNSRFCSDRCRSAYRRTREAVAHAG